MRCNVRSIVVASALMGIAISFTAAALAGQKPKAEDRIRPSGLQVCNKTDHRVAVAIGYRAKQGLTSEGWWNLLRQSCMPVLFVSLTDRYYYVFARDLDGGGSWGDGLTFCVSTKTFTIIGNKRCFLRGYREFRFMEVDTRGEEGWTVSLYLKDKRR